MPDVSTHHVIIADQAGTDLLWPDPEAPGGAQQEGLCRPGETFQQPEHLVLPHDMLTDRNGVLPRPSQRVSLAARKCFAGENP